MTFEEKTREFFKDKENRYLALILIFAFLIRLFYFMKTFQQPLWWDEAEYMSMAKSLFFNIPYEFNSQRPILFPLLEGIVMWIFAKSEFMVRLLLVFLPSLALVYVSYLLGKEMFDKKIGLFIAFLTSCSWIILFNTTRIHTDILAMLLIYTAILILWKYVKNEEKKYLWLIGILIVSSFMIRLVSALMGFVILIFLLLIYKLDFLKEKKLWIAVILGILLLMPYLVWSHYTFNNATAFLSGSHITSGTEGKYSEIGWHVLTDIFPWLFGISPGNWNITSLNGFFSVMAFLLFFIGFIFTLSLIFIKIDTLIKKGKEFKDKENLFLLLWIISYMAFFVFLIKDVEDRWLMPLAFALFALIAQVVFYIREEIKNVNLKKALVIIVLFGFFFVNFVTADNVIQSKVTSYGPVKDSALWVKERTNPGDIVITQSSTQYTYYAERQIIKFNSNASAFEEDLVKYKPKYVVASAFEGHPAWVFNYLQENQNRFITVQGYMMNENQPALIVYEVKYS
ncbi:glycosyltransferase family 39 protein [Candidatus Woesearchaeota archaeon]|nr:glycosyltransferase family 39 protein [Candidatus Woesearchaeota archaeon]